jgi:hypothetical protein
MEKRTKRFQEQTYGTNSNSCTVGVLRSERDVFVGQTGLLETPMLAHIVKKTPHPCETRMFITLLT